MVLIFYYIFYQFSTSAVTKQTGFTCVEKEIIEHFANEQRIDCDITTFVLKSLYYFLVTIY